MVHVNDIVRELRRAAEEEAKKPPLTFETAKVMDAKEMYDIIAASKKAGCGDMIYRWRKEGFDVEKDVSKEAWKAIARASQFMEQIVHCCPYFMRFDFYLDDEGIMKIHVDKEEIIQDVYGVNMYELCRILEPPYEREREWHSQDHGRGYWIEDYVRAVMPEEPVNLEAGSRFREALDEIKELMDTDTEQLYEVLWELVSTAVAPFGFRVERHSERNDMVSLLVAEEE